MISVGLLQGSVHEKQQVSCCGPQRQKQMREAEVGFGIRGRTAHAGSARPRQLVSGLLPVLL
jgi:hypothetical protein